MSLYEKFPETFNILEDIVFGDSDVAREEVVLIEDFLLPLIVGKIVLTVEHFDSLRKICGVQQNLMELVSGEWEEDGCDCLKCQMLRRLNNNAEFRLAAKAYLKSKKDRGN